MVQRKEANRVKLTPETKLHRESPKSIGGSCSDSKKKRMNNLPNYMKPTSSSDSRKEKLQVTQRNHSPNSSGSSRTPLKNSSPPSISSKRKAIKPFLKRNRGRILCPKLTVNRATCSSTLKDSKFPKALELSPGATEGEGTSVFRVCPYNYCSLNGHVHEPLPPLKSFLESRRKLIKTQQSMKLKGSSPFRKREPKKSEKEVSPLIKEVVNDFFVEIYASSKEKAEEEVKTGELNASASQIVKREEEEAVDWLDERDRLSSNDLDRRSDISIVELDAVVKFLEYVSCDQKNGDQEEKFGDLVADDCNEKKNPVEPDSDMGIKAENLKSFDMDFMEEFDHFSDNRSCSSECTHDAMDQEYAPLFEEKIEIIAHEPEKEVESPKVTEQSSNPIDEKIVLETEEREEEKFSSVNSEEETSEPVYEKVNDSVESENSNKIETGGDPKPDSLVDLEENTTFMEKGAESETENTPMVKEKEEEKEKEITVITSINNNELSDSDSKQQQQEGESIDGQLSDIENLSIAFSKMSLKGEIEEEEGDESIYNNRLIIVRRRRTTETEDYIRGFNPRSPNFLPLQPDPESERVDLRHQMMDERKNSEEWMIDFALRKAVNQLAPARKKKVALIVEAFETVLPVPGSRASPVQACS